jgi:putative transposase
MKRSRFSEEQIVHILRRAEAGEPVKELTRSLGVTEQTFYVWKKKYAGLGVPELRKNWFTCLFPVLRLDPLLA